jgi:uncharacterized RmlC-like cupin family protein
MALAARDVTADSGGVVTGSVGNGGSVSAQRSGPFADEFFHGWRDLTHTWGEFTEAAVDDATILREVLVYPGGRTSIHRHTTQSEIDIVVGGAVHLLLGDRPHDLRQRIVRAGEVFHVPAGMYHAVSFAAAENAPARPFARFLEVVVGYRSPDDIERHRPALPGQRPSLADDPLLDGLIRGDV